MSIEGYVHSFETLGALDGPGLRTVVFLSGCPLRCQYCHNPDTWERKQGKKMTAKEVVEKVSRYKSYFKQKGGVTLSGGEPLFQCAFATEILRLCKENDIQTALDTSGAIFSEEVKELLSYVDLVILDIKHTNNEDFFSLTGVEMANTLAFLAYCKEKQIPLWIRQVIVPTLTDGTENILVLKKLVQGANIMKIELLPYHTGGIYKWDALGLSYPCKDIPTPSPLLMERLNLLLKEL